jgi:hypothetical protein
MYVASARLAELSAEPRYRALAAGAVGLRRNSGRDIARGGHNAKHNRGMGHGVVNTRHRCACRPCCDSSIAANGYAGNTLETCAQRMAIRADFRYHCAQQVSVARIPRDG